MRFVIKKIGRKLDPLGGGTPDLFTNVSQQDLANPVYYNLMYR